MSPANLKPAAVQIHSFQSINACSLREQVCKISKMFIFGSGEISDL